MAAPNRFGDQVGEPPRRLAHLTAAGLLAVAGGLHLAALPSHLTASTLAGAFFATTAAAQLLGAVLVVTRPSTRTIHAVMAGNIAVLALWAISRTTGLPTGGELGIPEPLGLLDGLVTAAELLVIAASLATMIRAPKLTGQRHNSWRPALTLVLAWIITGGAGLALADTGHHHESGHAHTTTAPGDRNHHQPELSPPAPGPSHENYDPGQPTRQHAHNTPADSRQSHDTPTPNQATTGPACPAGHHCTDHSH